MKTLFTTMALASGLVMAVAGTASAGTPAQCDAYARAQTDAVYPLGRGTLTGGALGALGGLGVGALTGSRNLGKSAGVGALVGGGIGTVAYQNKRTQYFNMVYADCLRAGAPPPPPPPIQPIYAPVPPYIGTVYQTLNVRTGGSTAYPVLFVLQPYEQFQVVDCGVAIGFPGWCWVSRSNGQTGYASQSYLKPT